MFLNIRRDGCVRFGKGAGLRDSGGAQTHAAQRGVPGTIKTIYFSDDKNVLWLDPLK